MRRLSGATSRFAFTSLSGSPSSITPHALFCVVATPTLPLTGNLYRALSLDTAAFSVSAAILINDAGGVIFQQRDAAGSIAYTYTQTSVFSASSAPHALALVFDGTNCIAYVDGTQVNSASVTLGARGVFSGSGSQSDNSVATSMDVGVCEVFSQALSAAQVRTLGNARAPLGIDSSKVRGWWAFRSGRPDADLSKYQQTLTASTTAGAPDEKRAADMRRAKVFLPQYMLQPPIALTAGSRTNNPNVGLTSSAAVACTAGAGSNCPSATITASAAIVCVAGATSNVPSANITSGAAIVSTAAATSNVPSVTLLNAPAVASAAGAVSNAPNATLSPNYPVVSVASATSNALAAVTTSAPVASVASTVTGAPAATITGGLGATASSTTDAPAVTLQRNLPIVSAAGATSNATAAIGAGAPVASTSGSISNAPTATVTAIGAVASTATAVSGAPAASITAGAVVASVATTASNCPAAAISRVLQVAAVSGSRSDCPPAAVVPLLFLPVASVCRSVTDCPPPPPMTFFKDLTAPPIKQLRTWPPRPR